VRGLLAVSNQANRPTFDQGDETLLGTFATQATVTLENARLFEQTQRRARREQLAREIAGKIQAAGDVEAVLQTAVRELGRALGTPRSFVHLGTPGQSDAPPSRAPSAQKSPDVK
jgi:GAF domain-containing protein